MILNYDDSHVKQLLGFDGEKQVKHLGSHSDDSTL